MDKNDSYICPICGNTDIHSIGYLNGKPYCRRCISFRGEEVDDKFSFPKKAKIHLNYELSIEQKQLSNKLVENYKKGINSFVYAVCGSGKTEIVLNIISYAIQCGEKVGFAVPRRDVAIELWERFKQVFSNNKIVLVCGGYHDVLKGDLICLTTHQLFRYEKYFDLLIMDEVDAFPYAGNELLHNFFEKSLKGKYVLMSATITPELKDKIQKDGTCILELFTRYHKHPLPVPECVFSNSVFLYYNLIKYIKKFIKENKQIFIFCPTIDECEKVYKILRFIVKGGEYVHSKRDDRAVIINDFKNGKYKYLVTTAVLERGVTVKDLQVIVFKANHNVYNQYSLIQIAGRAGRKKEAPEGRVIFLATKTNSEIEDCISTIIQSNSNLQKLFQ
ncbi:MAG: DEAD/DEAH box helicase family protein [Bacilli bacterium]|nr:DEAD/DEAH box helicase family protein [Bacilli bacterium]